jgi:hypothetical protein
VVKGLSATVLTAVITLSLALAAGCARRGAEQPSEPEPTQTTDVLVPEWAPENPSPEFLRAAKVLKPYPLEELLRGSNAETITQAEVELQVRVWPAGYEFFGTLSDEQVERFLSGKDKEILIPVKTLTSKQRAALNRYFEASRQAMKDRIVELYKSGAKEDLSNVDAGFKLRGRRVNISCRVRKSEEDYSGFESTIATM